MAQLLVVETSPRGDRSVSRRLTRRFEAAWRDAHPGGTVVRRDLTETELPFVTLPWIAANFTPAAELSAEMRAVLRQSDLLVGELMAADHVAIGTPVYNYNVPAALKAWIDHVVRRGVTLGLDGKGLVTGKRATVLMASGGVYTEGSPIRERDIATQYLRIVLGSIGIGDVAFVAGGNAKSVDLGEVGMEDFVAGFEPAIAAAAARAG